MEPIFVNHYTPSPKLFEVFYKHTSQKYTRVVGVIGLVLLVSALLTLGCLNALTLPLVLVTALGVAVSVILLFFHKVAARGAINRTLKLHVGKIYDTYVYFYEDYFRMSEGDEELSFHYEDVTKVVECGGTLMALMFGSRSGVIIKKTGFAVGELRDFNEFLARKLG